MNYSQASANRARLQIALKNLLTNGGNTRQIMAARGRLISALRVEHRLAPPSDKPKLRAAFDNQSLVHQTFIANRLNSVKRDRSIGIMNQISREVILKFNAARGHFKSAREAQNSGTAVYEGVQTLKSTISGIASVGIKAPLALSLKLGQELSGTVVKLFNLPLIAPGYITKKLIDPNAQYNGAFVTKINSAMTKHLRNGLVKLEDVVRKI